MQESSLCKNLTNSLQTSILNKLKIVIKFPRSRGVSGVLYLQSALAGVIFCLGWIIVGLPFISGDDVWVLRNRNLRTVSGQE